MKSKTLSFDKSLKVLKETRQLNTGMLKAFNLPFEAFLRYAQLPDEKASEFIELLIKHLEKQVLT